MLSVCTSIPIYLVLVIEGCPFLEKFEQALKTYSKGAPSYNVWRLVPMLANQLAGSRQALSQPFVGLRPYMRRKSMIPAVLVEVDNF
jgi:hypothetical protein